MGVFRDSDFRRRENCPMRGPDSLDHPVPAEGLLRFVCVVLDLFARRKCGSRLLRGGRLAHEQAQKDLERLDLWDNSNSNVWFIPLSPWLKTTL
jgi:hypothetical protein